MGYYHLLFKKDLPKNHRSIALGVILQGMGKWLPGYNWRNPEIEVGMISSLSCAYRLTQPRGWRKWIQRMGIF
jgi:hypothetical protein